MLSPFLLVTKSWTSEIREGSSQEILFADDLMQVAESMKSMKKKVLVWKKQLKGKGVHSNVQKTKVM